jgi:hypothetical protein
VERIRPRAMVLWMLKRVRIDGEKVDRTVGRVAVFQGENLLKRLPAVFSAARCDRSTASTSCKRLRMILRNAWHFPFLTLNKPGEPKTATSQVLFPASFVRNDYEPVTRFLVIRIKVIRPVEIYSVKT